MSLSWLIIGGGIHGVHLAVRLIGAGRATPERLRIVDPGAVLLARWRTCTATTGMTHLRSPVVHHLGVHPWALHDFARKSPIEDPFAAPYDRPALDLFNAHCERLIRRFGLAALHLRGRAVHCALSADNARVTLDSGVTLEAQNVVLALGAGDRPHWPTWAPRDSARVHHVFASDFDGWPTAPAEAVAVVGGGISAAQVALRLADTGHRVHLIARHPLREHQFDSEPGWLGPKHMTAYLAEPDLGQRRAMIRAARHRGSVPPAVHTALHAAFQAGRVTWHEGSLEGAEVHAEGVRLTLAEGRQIPVERVLLATGFEAGRPGGALVDDLVEEAGLPCAACGFPITDAALRWHPRLRVTGPLAELELGPAARNIAGARRAGDRLLGAFRGRRAS